MTSKSVSSLQVITATEKAAMLKLVQMVTHHHEFDKVTPQKWVQYLVASFGWTEEKATTVINNLRRMANRELDREAV